MNANTALLLRSILKLFMRCVTVACLCTQSAAQTPAPKATSILSSSIGMGKELIRGVMSEFYGVYDQTKQCWVAKHKNNAYCMRPIKLEVVSLKGTKQYFVSVGGRQLDENGDPKDCHACLGALGLLVLAPNGSNVALLAKNNLYEDYETYGRSPSPKMISIYRIGPGDNYGWIAQASEIHGGEEYLWSQVYGVLGDNVALLASVITHYANPMTCESEGRAYCTDVSANLIVDQTSALGAFFPLILNASGKLRGAQWRKTYQFRFDESSRKYIAPTGVPEELRPFQ